MKKIGIIAKIAIVIGVMGAIFTTSELMINLA